MGLFIFKTAQRIYKNRSHILKEIYGDNPVEAPEQPMGMDSQVAMPTQETPVEKKTEQNFGIKTPIGNITYSQDDLANSMIDVFEGIEGSSAHVGQDKTNLTLAYGIVADKVMYNGKMVTPDKFTEGDNFDPSKVDMLVGDIYGNNKEALEKLGLPASLVASSFGKLVAREDPAEGLKQEDLARALLLMVTNNIGQVSYLNAQLHKTSRIYFVGNFLRGNKLSQRRLSYAINYWSKGEMEALFLEHEGYFGALGAFLLSQGISLDDLDPPKRPSDRSDSRRSHSFRNAHRRSQTLEEHQPLY